MIIRENPLRMGYITGRFAIDSGMNPFPLAGVAYATDDLPVWDGTTYVPKQRAQRQITASDQTTNATTYSDIAPLTIPIRRAGGHTFEYLILYVTSATSEGIGLQVAFGGVAAAVTYSIDMLTDPNNRTALVTAYGFGTGLPPTSVGPAAAGAIARVTGACFVTTPGDLRLQFRAETGGVHFATATIGSWARVYAQ